MVKRKRIGLLFTIDDSWTGGLYYLFNIINSLCHLNEDYKPHLTIFYKNKDVIDLVQNLHYPYLSFLPVKKKLSLYERVIKKLKKAFGNKDYYPQYHKKTVDFIFPCSSVFGPPSLSNLRKVYWIPDFQHKHLPHFFSQKELNDRDSVFQGIAAKGGQLVLSSNDAKRDFETFYPTSKIRIYVLQFASVLPYFGHVDKANIFKKYGIETPYFIAPNQFWSHKNHLVVLKAIELLKENNLNYRVLFTGKESDYRNPGYLDSLRKFVQENDIERYVRFLGFIDRAEQLFLIHEAHAVIQPSLFEGWSTVIEDAKAMNQIIIASNLRVHQEQCGKNAIYFNPHIAQELGQIIKKTLLDRPDLPNFSYDKVIKGYAEQIVNL